MLFGKCSEVDAVENILFGTMKCSEVDAVENVLVGTMKYSEVVKVA